MDDPISLPEPLAGLPTDRSAASPLSLGAPWIHAFDPSQQTTPTLEGFTGVRVYRDFISKDEAATLLASVERRPFLSSQSGKGKQHYGPRINFNKRKMNSAAFEGLPAYAHALETRMRERVAGDRDLTEPDRSALDSAVKAFQTTDLFVLRYQAEQFSNLDLHVDDVFAYGELILDLSLETDSTLTFLRGRVGSEVPAALETLAQTALSTSGHAGHSLGEIQERNGSSAGEARSDREDEELICVRVPMPARSLVMLYGTARTHWEHGILAGDVNGQRTSLTMRTLGPSLRATEAGRAVLSKARAVVLG